MASSQHSRVHGVFSSVAVCMACSQASRVPSVACSQRGRVRGVFSLWPCSQRVLKRGRVPSVAVFPAWSCSRLLVAAAVWGQPGQPDAPARSQSGGHRLSLGGQGRGGHRVRGRCARYRFGRAAQDASAHGRGGPAGAESGRGTASAYGARGGAAPDLLDRPLLAHPPLAPILRRPATGERPLLAADTGSAGSVPLRAGGVARGWQPTNAHRHTATGRGAQAAACDAPWPPLQRARALAFAAPRPASEAARRRARHGHRHARGPLGADPLLRGTAHRTRRVVRAAAAPAHWLAVCHRALCDARGRDALGRRGRCRRRRPDGRR